MAFGFREGRALGLLFSSLALAACGDSGTSGTASTGSGGSGGSGSDDAASSAASTSTVSTGSGIDPGSAARPIFLIVMENTNWSDVVGSAKAPYLNQLLTTAAHAEQAYNPPALHPSEPNYIWLEAGDNLGILSDLSPTFNSQTTTDHLVTQIEAAGLTWRSYQEDIVGDVCPLEGVGSYATKHNPMVYFEDVTNGNDPMSPRCIAHVRPFTELAADLSADTVSDYNFLTPNLCHDGHNLCMPENDSVKQIDDWLAANVPPIVASAGYARGGVIIITWDEGGSGLDGPIGLVVVANAAKPGYAGTVHYTHSSTLKTVQELLGLSPLLRHAGDPDTNDLADLFTTFP